MQGAGASAGLASLADKLTHQMFGLKVHCNPRYMKGLAICMSGRSRFLHPES
jgi:hypothetical protein